MSKHTPGPWEYFKNKTHAVISTEKLYDYGRPTIAKIWPGSCKESEANARLIAAAPEMLEALKNIQSNAKGTMPPFLLEAIMVAEYVIAKAEGK